MHAPVEHHSAAAGLDLAPVARNSSGADQRRLHVKGLTQNAVVKNLFGDQIIIVPAAVLAGIEHQSLFLCDCHDVQKIL